MKIKQIFLLPFLMGALCWGQTMAQGCSDAGFCTIGNLNQHARDTAPEYKHRLTLVLSNGIGDENVYVFTPGIQYDHQLNGRWSLQGKITGNYADGNLGTAAGLGDLFLSATYSPLRKTNWQTSFLLGTKLLLNSGNIQSGGKSLPMQYQSSLGTVDLLAGVTVANKKWLFATAIQQPLTGTNGNTFLPVYWNTANANKYPPGNDFKRKGDVLLRTGYNLVTKRKFNLNISLLGIYHLGNDTYIDGNISNNPIPLRGSAGLTLNGTAAMHCQLTSRLSLGLSGGLPFVVRDVRPDGLTRKFVLSPEIIYNF